MENLIYSSRKNPARTLVLLIIIFVWLAYFGACGIAYNFGTNFDLIVFLVVGAVVPLMFTLFLFDYVRLAADVDVFNDYLLIDDKKVLWKDIKQIKQLKRPHFIKLKFLLNNSEVTVIFNNKYTTKEHFQINHLTELAIQLEKLWESKITLKD